jgi:hypothetical protein
MTNIPPDWAFKRAAELRKQRGFTYPDAFAAYIAEHEQPPADRKLLCAREACAEWSMTAGHPDMAADYRSGLHDGEQTITLRAIELWEEGFGK